MGDVKPSPWLDSSFKRTTDIVIGVASLVIATPIIIVCSMVIRASSRGPAILRQERAGHHGESFVVFKLRTMRETRLQNGSLAPDEIRITRFGAILRRLSFDELPQIWNVLRGEMSIIGPRPLPTTYTPLYTGDQQRRQLAKPGLTGLSQVTWRNAGAWPSKLASDVEYVRTASWALDMRILFSTVTMVLTGRGISATGHATMPEFTGEESAPHR
jgi:sugar transferase EpsL